MEKHSIVNFPASLSGDYLWFLEIFIGVAVLSGVYFLSKGIIKHIRLRSISLSNDWKKRIDVVLVPPFKILLWVMGLTLVIQVLSKRFGFSFFENYLDSFRSTGFVLCAAWTLHRWNLELQRIFLNRDPHGKKIDMNSIQILGKIFSVGVFVIAIMIVLQVWGLDIAPLIAFGGIGAAAIGFASKDIIGNFFGGLMLHTTRPFMVGDTILIPDRKVDACVEEIGWYTTALRDKEKRPLYLPNALFGQVLVINSSRMTHRRIEERVGISYDDFEKLPELVDEIRKTITEHSAVDNHLPIHVCLNGLNQFSMDILIDLYILETRYEKYLIVKHEILSLVYTSILNAGLKIPNPTMNIVTAPQEQVRRLAAELKVSPSGIVR